MSDFDQSAEPVAEVETPESEPAELDAQETENLDEVTTDEGDQPEPEETEIELDGEKYKVPAKLKDAFLRNADYTRKTQEVAEQRRAIEAERHAIEVNRQALMEQAQRQQANIQAHAQVAALDQQLKQYEGVNWQALAEQDPAGAQKHWIAYQQARDQRGQIANYLAQQDQQATLERQQAIAKSLEEGRQILAKEIKGWSSETAKQVRDYGKSIGFTDAELAGVVDPRAVKMLHKAMLFDQQLAKAKQAPKPSPEVPLPKVIKASGSATVTNPDKLNVDDWLKWRQKQLRKNRD